MDKLQKNLHHELIKTNPMCNRCNRPASYALNSLYSSNNYTMEWLIPLGFFALVYGMVYLNARKKERLALLEYNKDASIFQAGKVKNVALKWGLLLMGIGIGFLLANVLIRSERMEEEAAYFSMSFLFGGFGLVASYIIDLAEYNRYKKENHDTKQQ
ncbi:MAG: hypothetical protein PHU97_02880 [Bacteroidales bacterium]|nr:hypothetical protein [Bacteroidales bacterium]MDD3010246.1 hypothetical protein [Bacteroidales bacterium]MDD3961978.1 hypothetical protein [Bacteroidales bacterium]MDY0284899.1 hypothetical protein [Bacteroidales bacterium]